MSRTKVLEGAIGDPQAKGAQDLRGERTRLLLSLSLRTGKHQVPSTILVNGRRLPTPHYQVNGVSQRISGEVHSMDDNSFGTAFRPMHPLILIRHEG
jgi:hypothetical protein